MFSLKISPYCFAKSSKDSTGTSLSMLPTFPSRGIAGGCGIGVDMMTNGESSLFEDERKYRLLIALGLAFLYGRGDRGARRV
jgi:hypothetical protein